MAANLKENVYICQDEITNITLSENQRGIIGMPAKILNMIIYVVKKTIKLCGQHSLSVHFS